MIGMGEPQSTLVSIAGMEIVRQRRTPPFPIVAHDRLDFPSTNLPGFADERRRFPNNGITDLVADEFAAEDLEAKHEILGGQVGRYRIVHDASLADGVQLAADDDGNEAGRGTADLENDAVFGMVVECCAHASSSAWSSVNGAMIRHLSPSGA